MAEEQQLDAKEKQVAEAPMTRREAVTEEARAPTRKLQAFIDAKGIATEEFSDQYDNGLAKIISERKMFNGTTFVNGQQYIAKDKAAFMETVKAKLDKQTLDMERQYVANAYAAVIPDENGNLAQPDHVNVAFVKSFNVLTQKMTEDELEEWLYRIDAFSKSRRDLINEEGKAFADISKETEERNNRGERIKDIREYMAFRFRIAYRLENGTFFDGSEQDLADLLYCDALRLDFKSLAGIEKATQIMTAAKFLSQESQAKIKNVIERQLRFANEASPEQKASVDVKKSFVKAKLAELGIDADAAENAALHAELLLALEGSTMSRSEWDGYVEKMAKTYNLRKQMALDANAFSLRISGLEMQKGDQDIYYAWPEDDRKQHEKQRQEDWENVHTAEAAIKYLGTSLMATGRLGGSYPVRLLKWIEDNVVDKYILEKDDAAE